MEVVLDLIVSAVVHAAAAAISTLSLPFVVLRTLLATQHKISVRQHQFFEGKTVWITGASSGIGRAIALELGRLGVEKLVLCGRSLKRLENTCNTVQQFHTGCTASGTEQNSRTHPQTISLQLDVANLVRVCQVFGH